MFSFAHRVLNHSECGAFEAAFTLIGLPIHATDPGTTVKWLDVKTIRKRRLKPFKEIEKLDPESIDLYYDGLIDTHYPGRPVKLESMNLYDFVR